MVYNSAKISGLAEDLSSFGLIANASKALLTDMMQSSAQSLLQLVGAKGYRRDHIAGRGVVDSRPFQIFEGSNDVMYLQTADVLLKAMKKQKTTRLSDFLEQYSCTKNSAVVFHRYLSFKLDADPLQRQKVILGKILSWLMALELTTRLRNTGFNAEMIDNAFQVVEPIIAGLTSGYQISSAVSVIESYRESADWQRC